MCVTSMQRGQCSGQHHNDCCLGSGGVFLPSCVIKNRETIQLCRSTALLFVLFRKQFGSKVSGDLI